MQVIIDEFIAKLHTEKDISSNTEISYKRDLNNLFKYLKITEEKQIYYVNQEALEEYISHLNEIGRAPTTISRSIASMKSFFSFLLSYL